MTIIFDQYEERLERVKRSPTTRYHFRKAADGLTEYLHEQGLTPETADGIDLEEYFASLPYAASTKKLHLSHLKAAFGYALRRGTVTKDPTVDVLIEREPDKEPAVIPNAELREMKARLVTDREWLLWHLLVYTGMRRHELLALKWGDVKLADHTITIVGKGGKLRHVPIHPALYDVLVERGEHEPEQYVLANRRGGGLLPMSRRKFWDVLKCITREKYQAHAFRRTVASSLYANGVPGDTIDKILGWSPRSVRTRYYQAVADAQLQRAILQLYRDDPI